MLGANTILASLGTDILLGQLNAFPASGGAVDSGKLIQVVNATDSAAATGTTIIPFDDTTPQQSETVIVMSAAITPTSATNRLLVEVCVGVSISTQSWLVSCLFQDSAGDALATAMCHHTDANNMQNLFYNYSMTAGTTSETTLKVGIGIRAGTFTFNGESAARLFGGTSASSITISEIEL